MRKSHALPQIAEKRHASADLSSVPYSLFFLFSIMSWQAYTDNLVASGKLDKAALYLRAGDSLWAQSGSFQLSAPEIASIAHGYDDPSDLQTTGLHVQGQKYFLLRADDRSIYGKRDAEGVIAVRTKQTILIAHYPAGVVAGDATAIVEKLADYLISVSY